MRTHVHVSSILPEQFMEFDENNSGDIGECILSKKLSDFHNFYPHSILLIKK